jgi:hypothetical protein
VLALLGYLFWTRERSFLNIEIHASREQPVG